MLSPQRGLRCLAFIPAILVLVIACGGNSDGEQARVWEPYEITLDSPIDVDNPFDPAQADVQAIFASPSGETLAVTAFASRDYERKLIDGKEHLTSNGALQWKVRFTPTEPGAWTWRWTLNGVEQEGVQTIKVSEPREGRHGFLRVSPDDSRYLQFDDGAPYFAIGENLAWYGERGTYDYDDWFEKLSAQGVNYVRLWMPSWAFGLEWTEPNTLGNYAKRLDRAWQLDYVLHQAAERGIYVLLCLQNHGAFSLTANSEWDGNPYNAGNGGPLTRPADVFTDQQAKELFQRRLRYVVARWGAYPNVLGWELWNEVDLSSTAMDAVLPWHDEMSTYLRDIDPYDHLITTSTSLPWSIAAVSASDLTSFDSPLFAFWQMKNIDFSQAHLYALGGSSVDFGELVPDISANLLRFDKPTLLAEAGVSADGPDETITADPGGLGFHDMLWAGLFAQTMGTGMTWWWDNVIDPEDWYSHFGPVATITRDIEFAKQGFEARNATATAPDKPLRAQTLIGETTVLVWVKNTNNQWYSPDKAEIADAQLSIADISEGTWHATWLNTYNNRVISEADISVSGSSVPLRIPPFERDIALRLDRK